MQKLNCSTKWLAYGACVLVGSTAGTWAQGVSEAFPPGIEGVQARLAALEAIVASQAAEIAHLKDKLQHFSREGNEIYITGANLNILSGAGTGSVEEGTWAPGPVNGLGNLVIGYNEDRTLFESEMAAERTGSHNLVIGPLHSYISNGGILGGIWNTVAAPHAGVFGGIENKALGFGAVVTGGSGNIASGDAAAVSGGAGNSATANSASVSGGFANTAVAPHASVTGGSYNAAVGPHSSATGGHYNAALGEMSAVSGGYANTAVGSFSLVVGGGGNITKGDSSVVAGGMERTAEGALDWAAGGLVEDY